MAGAALEFEGAPLRDPLSEAGLSDGDEVRAVWCERGAARQALFAKIEPGVSAHDAHLVIRRCGEDDGGNICLPRLLKSRAEALLEGAVDTRDYDVVRCVVAAAVNVDPFAAWRRALGDAEYFVRLVEECGVSWAAVDRDSGFTLLHLAALDGHAETTAALLRLCADAARAAGEDPAAALEHWVNLRSHEDDPPLALASTPGVVALLAQHHAHLEARGSDELAPLGRAADVGAADVVATLLEYGANPDAAGPGDDRIPLHYAARRGCVQTVRALLPPVTSPALLDSVDAAGLTPLFYAARWDHPAAVCALVGAGASLYADGVHTTPLLVAAAYGNLEVCRVLLAAATRRVLVEAAYATPDARVLEGEAAQQAFIDAVGSGRTALHHASMLGDAPLAALLLSCAADASISDPARRTPLHLAARTGCIQTVRVLLHAHPAAVAAVDEDARTPLHYAAMRGNQDVAAALVAAGASASAADAYGHGAGAYAEEVGHALAPDRR
eukprot:TRINITY_DN8201_c0_g1_i1.p1 TRINITY_DN8201_c0_g1~~TRINITY_DN8201_c0_g1_i1.p1  ORF type:complete len:555 (+),score=169.86 TRINITY_DN8201_c0_g1_i1:170-1666(+)